MALGARWDCPEGRKRLRVHGVLWNALCNLSLAYALSELLDNMPKGRAKAILWCLRSDPNAPRKVHRPALPPLLFRVLCKAGVSMSIQGRLASVVTMREIQAGDIVYMWPPYDLSVIKRAQGRGAVVVAERTNCMGQMFRSVLERAYGRRGLPLPDDICTDEDIAIEREQMLACDFVTAANPFVSESLLEAGIRKDQILETAYGFSPARLQSAIGLDRPDRLPVFLFVGSGIVRKGLDVLLEAWKLAEVKGKLLIAGSIDEEIRRSYADVLARTDVLETGFVDDVARVYAEADVFVFPTHEEGGPLVTYEAAACGLGALVSPMGAGRIIRDQEEGMIVDPLSVGSVAGALRRFADDGEFRVRMGKNAAKRSLQFTWEHASEHLLKEFHRITGSSARRLAG